MVTLLHTIPSVHQTVCENEWVLSHENDTFMTNEERKLRNQPAHWPLCEVFSHVPLAARPCPCPSPAGGLSPRLLQEVRRVHLGGAKRQAPAPLFTSAPCTW